MSADDMLQVLKRFVASKPTQKAAATELGVSASFLNDTLYRGRPISAKIAEKLGYKRSVTYEKAS